MARWLADQGADVFVVDLRAAGDSRFTPTSRSGEQRQFLILRFLRLACVSNCALRC
jgi:hypothetical protein